MGWATRHIERLRAGETIRFRPHGNSMTGIVNNGDLVEVAPLTEPPRAGDVVLCKVRGVQYLHLVNAVQGDRVQIANARGHINGWTSLAQVFGRLIAVNPA